jgi:hypothetical protein
LPKASCSTRHQRRLPFQREQLLYRRHVCFVVNCIAVLSVPYGTLMRIVQSEDLDKWTRKSHASHPPSIADEPSRRHNAYSSLQTLERWYRNMLAVRLFVQFCSMFR